MKIESIGDRSGLRVVAFFLPLVAPSLVMGRLGGKLDPRRTALLALGGFLALAMKARKIPGVQTKVHLDKVDPDGLDDVVDDLEGGHGGRRSGDGRQKSRTRTGRKADRSQTKKPKVHARFNRGGSNGSDDDHPFYPGPAPWEDGGSIVDRVTLPALSDEVFYTLESLIWEEFVWES